MKEAAKRFMEKIVPSPLIQEIIKYREMKDLKKLTNPEYSVNRLRYIPGTALSQIFTDPSNEMEWATINELVKDLDLPEMTGGVNRGDQRAIFYLINYFKPDNVLEIGTHIGCSTVHIALALRQNAAAHLTTVDIVNINDPFEKNWLRFNSKHSPAELMTMIDAETKVSFVTNDSINFLKNCRQKFDFVFLDGSHKAKMVFREIPLALHLLNKNGIILLHDYFPGNKPLWKNVSTIPGPYLAVNKIISEENKIAVIPLAELPWATKINSRYTSLALLTRRLT